MLRSLSACAERPVLSRAEANSNRARSAGFTLIEVLAALVIVSLGMLGVIQAVNQTVNNTNYLREKSIAHWVAMNRLTEARLGASAPNTDTTHGNTQMAGRDWRWTMKVTPTDVSSMLRLEISVAPADAGEDASLASISGFYGKAIASPTAAAVQWQSSPNPQAGPSPETNAAPSTGSTPSTGTTTGEAGGPS